MSLEGKGQEAAIREALEDCVEALETLGTFHRHGDVWHACSIAQTIEAAKSALTPSPAAPEEEGEA